MHTMTTPRTTSRAVRSVSVGGRAGFTIIELLVVVSIIVLMIAILLPSLAKARQSAQQVTCLSQIRSVGQAFHIYMADNKEYFPRYNAPSPPAIVGYNKWVQVLVRGQYVLGNTFICPGRDSGYANMYKWRDPLAYSAVDEFWEYPDLGYNYLLGWYGWKSGETPNDFTRSVNFSQVNRPDRLLLATDVVQYNGTYPNFNVGTLYMEKPSLNRASFPTHQGTCNTLFADASAFGTSVDGGATSIGRDNLKVAPGFASSTNWNPY